MNMQAYKGLWIVFTIFVLLPAFMMASNVEGLGFEEGRFAIQCGLMELYIPQAMSWVLSFPVTVMAILLPGSLALSTGFGNLVWPMVGPFLVALFLLTIDPPGYKPDTN
jgi:hypothetical protein